MSMPIAVALLIIGVPLLIIDLVVGALLLGVVALALWITARGTKTTGEVVRIGEKRGSGRYTRFRVSYVTPDGNFETGGISERPQLGEPVTVRYHRSRPSVATTETRPWRRAFTGVPVVLAVAAVSAGMIVSAVWYFNGSYPQLQEPLGGASFAFALAFACGYYATNRCALLLGWRRMVQTEGKVLRGEPSSRANGPVRVLISFQSAEGHEEFRAPANAVHAELGDTVTVYYDPARPIATATVHNAGSVRSGMLGSMVLTLVFGALGVFAVTLL